MMSRKPTCGVVLHRPKTAALFFDSIYGPTEPGMPPNIVPFPLKGGKVGSKFHFQRGQGDLTQNELRVEMPFAKAQQDIEQRLPELLEHLVQFGFHPIPVYDSAVDIKENCQVGEEAVITAAISNVGIVDEYQLDWQQVAEIRDDDESNEALRRFRHWFDTGLATREQAFVEDELLRRLEAYDMALKKHGVMTFLGESQSVINSATFMGALTGVFFPEYWAASAIVLAANVVVKVAKAKMDRRFIKHDHSEIAYIHSLRQRFGESSG